VILLLHVPLGIGTATLVFTLFSRSAALDDKVNAGTKRRNIDQIFKQAASHNSLDGVQLGYPLVDRFIR